MKTTHQCEKCSGSGIYPAADSPDDFTMEVCDCEAGKKKEMLEEVLSDDEFGGTTVGDVLNMTQHND